MFSTFQSCKDKIYHYYGYDTSFLYLLTALSVFVLYTVIDTINTFIFTFYPIYHTVYAQGSADSVYFMYAVDQLLSFKLPTSNFDGAILALLIYTIPISFAKFFSVDIGFSFRIFYLLILLCTGYGIYLTGTKLFSDQTGYKLSLSFIFNPFIFILSVWAGSEEIIEALFFVFILYFIVTDRIKYAILLIFVATFYKYYTILLLPGAVLSIKDPKTRLKVISALTIFFSVIGFLFLIFLNKYVVYLFDRYIASFQVKGKGIYNLLVEYAHFSLVNEILIFGYYLLMFCVYVVFLYKTRHSDEPFKYGLVFLLFFILYPEFYSSYLIIPFVSVALLYPLTKNHVKLVNFIVLPIASALYEFAFNYIDSPYSLLHIEPNLFLRLIGIIFVFCLYGIMLLWLYSYFKFVYSVSEDE